MKHLLRKVLCFFKGDKRYKWPRSLWEIEQVIYPYFLQAFDMDPEKEYEKGRDILEACLSDVYLVMKGHRPKVEMDSEAEIIKIKE